MSVELFMELLCPVLQFAVVVLIVLLIRRLRKRIERVERQVSYSRGRGYRRGRCEQGRVQNSYDEGEKYFFRS